MAYKASQDSIHSVNSISPTAPYGNAEEDTTAIIERLVAIEARRWKEAPQSVEAPPEVSVLEPTLNTVY